jgi:hypothetical protein
MTKRRLRATITSTSTSTLASRTPTARLRWPAAARRELFANPFAYWSAQELRGDRTPPDVVRVDRHVEVEAAPVDELAPEQVGMRLAPRRPAGWSELELAGFLGKRVWFATLDGRQVTAEVASVGAWSVEVAATREQHPLGYGAYVNLWVPTFGYRRCVGSAGPTPRASASTEDRS